MLQKIARAEVIEEMIRLARRIHFFTDVLEGWEDIVRPTEKEVLKVLDEMEDRVIEHFVAEGTEIQKEIYKEKKKSKKKAKKKTSKKKKLTKEELKKDSERCKAYYWAHVEERRAYGNERYKKIKADPVKYKALQKYRKEYKKKLKEKANV